MSVIRSLSVEKPTTFILFSRPLTTSNPHTSIKSSRWFTSNGHIFKNETDPETEPPISTHFTHLGQNISFNNPFIINKIISFCSRYKHYNKGIQFHNNVIKLGLTSNVYINSSLVGFYANCGFIEDAHKVFDEMPERNGVAWNSLILGYLQCGCPEKAIGLFLSMVRGGVVPNDFSVSIALMGCARLGDGWFGGQVHGLSLKFGVLENVVVGTGLIDMYSKCWRLEDSRSVFDMMHEKNEITWSAMVSGYAYHNMPNEAMLLFREMQLLDLESSYVTCTNLLSSFSRREHLDHCIQIHCYIVRKGFTSNEYIQTSIVTAYAKCKCSLKVFETICSSITKWSQISWNALIAGFCCLECSEKALDCFSNMRRSGVASDVVTLTSVLSEIGLISALELGKQVHALAYKTGSTSNLHVQNGLISMYGRCGLINESKAMFLQMKEPDLISWNSLLAGYSHHGKGQEVIELFEEMQMRGIQFDINTIISVLSACSHNGLVEKGLEYFELAKQLDSYEPFPMEVYVSMVDMLGRAGLIYEAEVFITNMPIQPGPSVYKSLISACKIHGNAEAGYRALNKLLERWPHDRAAYVLLSNSFATRGRWGEASEIQKLLHQRMGKCPGQSWI